MQEIKKKKSNLNTCFPLGAVGSPGAGAMGTKTDREVRSRFVFQITLQLPVYTGLVGLMKPSSVRI